VEGCKQSGLSEACLSCFLTLPDLCSGDPDPTPCAAVCSGGQGGSGGSGGSGGAAGTAGSGPVAGSAGSGPVAGSGGSGPVAGSGGNTGGTTSSGGSGNTAKSGVCRAIPNNQGGSNQGGSGGSGGGGVNCNALCSKASGCQNFDANTCATNCPQVSEGCRVCINNAPDICNTVATNPSSTNCLNECSGGQGGSGGSGGSNTSGSGGSDAGSSGSGGSSTSENTCTLNGTKYNCPSAEAAQKCFDDFAPGECTPA
jgi:hypothetical protein